MRTLRILNLEDSPLDVELIRANLAEAGIACEVLRVQTRDDFCAALEKDRFDLILSDYSLPSFDGLSALEIARETYPKVPFILVSGAIGEERAIEALKSGATDYVLKHRLERLVPAVRRAMREAEEQAERRKAQEALRESEERYRLLVESVKDYAIFMVSTDGRVANWNAGAERIFGYREEEIIGEPFSVIFTPGDVRRGAPEQELAQAMDEGRGEDFRWHVRKDGSRFWASGFLRPILDRDGNLRGFSKAVRDMTERRRAEMELRRSEERYRAVVEQSAEGIYLLDAGTRRILETNPSLQEMFGYTADELRGMEIYDLIAHPREDVDSNLQRTLKEGRRFVGERKYRRKDGSLVDVEVGVSTISYESTEVVCAVVRDITERKRTEEALREVREAERRRMARDLHDGALQDLAYALAEMEIVRMIPDDPERDVRLERVVEALRRTGQELRGTVYDLRLGAERNKPFPVLLESLVEQNCGMAPDCAIELAVGSDVPSAPLGEAGTELLRVFQEALTNARRHSGARHIRVSLRVEGECLVAEVADDGRGFEPDAAPGVGLRSMEERAAMLGGSLEVGSAPGRGTRVRFRASMSGLLKRYAESGREKDSARFERPNRDSRGQS